MDITLKKSSRFEKTVQTLLDALSSGITIIRRHRRRRRGGKACGDSSLEREESRLSESLRRSRADVRAVYDQHLAIYGRRFVKGDLKAKSSFASILSRLNVGFTSFISKFRKGKYSPSDIHALVNLSNSSRLEALKTFRQFSARISQASLTPVAKPKRKSQRSSKSDKELRRSSLESSSSKSRHKTTSTTQRNDQSVKMKPQTLKSVSPGEERAIAPADRHPKVPKDDQDYVTAIPIRSARQARQQNRASMISFRSDSTKIGEVVENNATIAMRASQDQLFNTAYPLSPWEKPPKSPSRFMRLFRITD